MAHQGFILRLNLGYTGNVLFGNYQYMNRRQGLLSGNTKTESSSYRIRAAGFLLVMLQKMHVSMAIK